MPVLARGPEVVQMANIPRRATRRQARARFRREISRVLEPHEVKLLLAILRADEHGHKFRCSRLGVGESLVRRHWLERDQHGNVSLSPDTRKILADCEAGQ